MPDGSCPANSGPARKLSSHVPERDQRGAVACVIVQNGRLHVLLDKVLARAAQNRLRATGAQTREQASGNLCNKHAAHSPNGGTNFKCPRSPFRSL
eukprot:3709661-Pyramimonas_sp.AAC.1